MSEQAPEKQNMNGTAQPQKAIAGGTVLVYGEIGEFSPSDITCSVSGIPAPLNSVRSGSLSLRIPSDAPGGTHEIVVKKGDSVVITASVEIGHKICDEMHIVANPAVNPVDNSIIVTKSGGRGQQLPKTLFRIDEFGVNDLPTTVLNPTGVVFDSNGKLFVTNRADGELIQINDEAEPSIIATGLGIATGIAVSDDGTMYVGDRTGNIFKISALGDAREFATLDSSVSAYHLAFDLSGDLYVAAPGLCSHDSIYRIDQSGNVSTFFKGLGRPQGLVFDEDGNLLAAACYKGRHGVVKVSGNGELAEHYVSGASVVGVIFDNKKRLLVATSEALYRFD